MIIQRTEVYVKEELLGERFEYIELYREYIYMFYCYLKILGKSSNLTKTCFKWLGKKTNWCFGCQIIWIMHLMLYNWSPEASRASFPDLENWNHLNVTWKGGRFGPSFKLSKELVFFLWFLSAGWNVSVLPKYHWHDQLCSHVMITRGWCSGLTLT